MSATVDELTEGQKECLRLFYARYDAKEIARQLGIAPATVHQRLTAARKKLGVTKSMEAARLLVQAEGPAPVYDRMLYDGTDIAAVPEHLPNWVERLPWPFPTRWRPENDLSLPELLIAILAIASFFMLAMALYFIAIRLVSDAL
ncbi:MAG: helix-turn-helix transcriptional regulator [Sphingomonas sp.]